MDIILASSSPRRTQLLTQIGIVHEVMAPDVDESQYVSLEPRAMVRTLALKKVEAIRQHVHQGLIVGSDTTVILGDRILGKPHTKEDAKNMLQHLSGRDHTVCTGVAVMDAATGRYRLGHSEAKVWLAAMTPYEIAAYIASKEPMDKAGSYSIQGLCAKFVERIDGDYYAVVGLPLAMTSRFLADLGYRF